MFRPISVTVEKSSNINETECNKLTSIYAFSWYLYVRTDILVIVYH